MRTNCTHKYTREVLYMGLENRKLMQKIAAVITSAAIILPSAAVYADPDGLDTITGSGAADIIDAPSEDSEVIGDDNTNSGGSTNSSEDSSSDNLIDNAVSNDSADDEQDNDVYTDDADSDAAVTADETAEPTATPEPKQTRLINGDFEYPKIETDKLENNWHRCGPWYDSAIKDMANKFENGNLELFNSKFGWKTTDKDGIVELVYGKQDNGNEAYGISPYGKDDKRVFGVNSQYFQYQSQGETTVYGRQFAELCAEDQTSLYQTISTTPGAVLSWGLKHRARRKTIDKKSNQLSNGKDTMALFIGKAQETSLTKPAAGVNILGTEADTTSKNDIFMWMAELLKNTGKINITTNSDNTVTNEEGVGQENMKSYTVYSKEDVNAKDVNINNYNQYFSLEYDAENKITKEWKCWIITDEQAWNSYEGIYDVEAGQTETTFAFTALTGIRTSNETDLMDRITEGNLLDDVTFSASYPLNVSTTASGTGTVTISDYDIDANVDKDTTHNGNYLDGTEVTITATPNEDEGASSCSFIGAYIDGTMYEAGNSKFDYDEDSNTYTFTETINKPRNIQLIFAKASTVTYDPNGGTYKGSEENTEYRIIANDTEEESNDANGSDGKVFEGLYDNEDAAAIPKDETNSRFIGWYFARGNCFISSDHKVEYVKNGANGNNTGEDKLRVLYHLADLSGESVTSSDDYKKIDVPATSGVTFVAQYEHLQKAIVVVKDTTDILYKEPGSMDTKDYGTVNTTVTSTINLTDGIELISDGYGRTSDDWGKDIENTAVMHMKLDESGEYMFMGWYTEANGGEKLSDASIYSYPISGPRTVYARFSRNLQYPYLSFVARDNSEAMSKEGTPFSIGSHIKVGENIVSTYDGKGEDENVSISEGHYGGVQYGNTISTGFIANINKNNASDLTSKYCTWTITIPADGTYIKKAGDSSEINGVTFGEAVLNDSSGDTAEKVNDFYNKGNIYEVKKVNNTDGKLTLKLYDVLPAAVSGEMTITYGIIIDNLYAPGAKATMTFEKEGDAVNISEDGEGIIHSNDFNNYVSGSPYAKQNAN